MKNTNKYNVAARAGLLALALTAAFALNTTAVADTLFQYTGDFNSINGLANEQNTFAAGVQAGVYDDFTTTQGWTVDRIFSDNLVSTSILSANWEIRSGVSEMNAGTLVASGSASGSNLSVTATGRGAFGFLEYQVEVLNLAVNLAPGTYWLNVTPVGNNTGRSFQSDTSGANCIGTCGSQNPGNAFFNSTSFGTFFDTTANQGQPGDFSFGLAGNPIPEPATIALLTCGVGALLIAVRRRRS